MSDPISPEFASRLEELRQRYSVRAASDLQQLMQDALGMATQTLDAAQLDTVHQQLHKLAGSSGTFTTVNES